MRTATSAWLSRHRGVNHGGIGSIGFHRLRGNCLSLCENLSPLTGLALFDSRSLDFLKRPISWPWLDDVDRSLAHITAGVLRGVEEAWSDFLAQFIRFGHY